MFFRGKNNMFCFYNKRSVVAENVSATFLYPEITPNPTSSVLNDARNVFSVVVTAPVSGVTPTAANSAVNEGKYIINQEVADFVSVSAGEFCADDYIDCEPSALECDAVISVKDELQEEPSPVFLVKKHIPFDFYVAVCDRNYLPLSAIVLPAGRNYRKYCCSVRGFTPCGIGLKIRIQSFKL